MPAPSEGSMSGLAADGAALSLFRFVSLGRKRLGLGCHIAASRAEHTAGLVKDRPQRVGPVNVRGTYVDVPDWATLCFAEALPPSPAQEPRRRGGGPARPRAPAGLIAHPVPTHGSAPPSRRQGCSVTNCWLTWAGPPPRFLPTGPHHTPAVAGHCPPPHPRTAADHTAAVAGAPGFNLLRQQHFDLRLQLPASAESDIVYLTLYP